MEIECPGCKWKGPVPDKALGKKLRCPLCRHEFLVEAPQPSPPPSTRPKSALAEDELELVEDDPPQEDLGDFQIVEDDKKERLSSKRKDRDKDDDDDRPRKKRRERDEDDEEDEDRPKKRRSRKEEDEDDEDEEEKNRPKKRKPTDPLKLTGAQTHTARQAVYLNHMAAYMYLGSLLIFDIFLLIMLFVPLPAVLICIPGLLGLANWVVAIIGFIFALGGPKAKNAQPLTIATLCVAGVHFLIALGGLFATAAWGGLNWFSLITSMFFLPFAIFLVGVGVIIEVLGALLEVARMILHCYVLDAHAVALKEPKVSEEAKKTVMIVGIIAGVLLVFGLSFGIVLHNSATTTIEGGMRLLAVAFLITDTCVVAMVFTYHRLLQTAPQNLGSKSRDARMRGLRPRNAARTDVRPAGRVALSGVRAASLPRDQCAQAASVQSVSAQAAGDDVRHRCLGRGDAAALV